MQLRRPLARRVIPANLFLGAALVFSALGPDRGLSAAPALRLNGLGYFETRGLNVLVFSNWYDSNFSDSKISGVELIHHEVRTATNGDVRLSATPGQWDPIGKLIDRKMNAADGSIEALLAYPEYDFRYTVRAYAERLGARVKVYREQLDRFSRENPFGVPISTGGWAGAGEVIRFAVTNYTLHKAFPAVIDAESVFRGLNFVYGCHPGSDVSFVSGVGTVSKEVAYGMNRADFSFIAGGVVPGVLIIKPDFPENKEDWPFLWGENEYVVDVGANYIFLVNAVNDMLK